MSLRLRIALLAGVVVLLSAAVAGTGTAASTSDVARARVDDQLQRDADRLLPITRQSLSAIVLSLQVQSLTCANPAAQEPSAAEMERRLAERRRGPVAALRESVQVIRFLARDGSVATACADNLVGPGARAVADSGTGSLFTTETVGDEQYRIMTVGVGELGAVQLGRPLEVVESAVDGLLRRSLLFSAIGAVFAAAIGWLLAKRATRPVELLSRAADRVAATQDLRERIDLERSDELGKLAANFNTMLASLDESRTQQQRLVQDASHELRTPLTSIRTNVDLLQRHPDLDPATRRQMLQDIDLELAELTELTAELVDSATEVHPTDGSTTELEFERLVRVCAERAERRHRRPVTVTVRSSGPAGAPAVVEGDPTLLTRAITNLFTNAAKFSPSESPIDVEVEEGRLTVNDAGPGIAPEDLPRIFDRFYRADDARAQPGSGLGLSIVRQIVDAHGGTVHASNRTSGGAAVGFTLPTVDAGSPPADPQPGV